MAVPAADELTRRQILFREVNERVLEVIDSDTPEIETIDFLCECSSDDCIEVIALTNEEYEAVRSSGTRFAVVPGHETSDAEKVVFRGDHFIAIEKTARPDLALAADP
jgi:hypothetical protein